MNNEEETMLYLRILVGLVFTMVLTFVVWVICNTCYNALTQSNMIVRTHPSYELSVQQPQPQQLGRDRNITVNFRDV